MAGDKHEENQAIPEGQKWFDNLTVMIIASVIFTILMYNVWAFIDLSRIPPLP